MLFSDEGKKIKELEARLKRLEKKIDKKFEQMDYSFETFRDIVIKMQNEKNMVEKERGELEKRLMSITEKRESLELPIVNVNEEIKYKIVKPARKKFEEDVELIKTIARIEAEDEKNEKR